MTHCPICRARYRLSDNCRRCGTDLQLLLSLSNTAECHARRAIHLLMVGDMDRAGYHAGKAKVLHCTTFNRLLDGFIAQCPV